MSTTSEIISRNLRRVRQERSLTLDKMSALTGVSKSMLSEIERCAKSPTIAVLEKICDGLNIPLAQITYSETPQVSLKTKDTIRHYSAWEGFEMFILFEFDASKKFEIFRHVIEPHAQRQSQYHEAGIREYLICTKGVFGVQTGDESYILQEGEALQFLANHSHCYFNPSDEPAHILMLLYHE